MYVPSILPSQIQSLRPSKRKIVKTVYSTEKFAQNVQSELPQNMRGFAQSISEVCHRTRDFMTKVN